MDFTADDVMRFLRAHPDFLAEHGELFTELTVPHPQHDGQAISLAERQLHALRDKIRQLEMKLAELIRFGEQNDDISSKVHRLALALIEAGDGTAARHALLHNLREDFAVPHAALQFWLEDQGETVFSAELCTELAKMEKPYCGAPDNIELLSCFGEAGPHVRSLALIPLRDAQQVVGVLALGSAEAERFYADMGTFYLRRIGELVSAALLRAAA